MLAASSTTGDAELVVRARDGDLEAFGLLVERHREVVHRVASRIVGRSDAEDVTQDALLRAFHRLRQYRGDAPFRSWLLRITQNTALNALDKRRAQPMDDEQLQREQDLLLHSEIKTPAANLEATERRNRLRSKIMQLRPQHRDVLVMRDLGELTYEEIAEMTESPLGSVKGRLHRARNELIELLRNNTYDWDLPDDD